MIVAAVLENGAQNESSKLMRDKLVVINQNLVDEVVNLLNLTIVDDPLNDSAAILVLAEHHQLLIDLLEQRLNHVALFAHVDEYLLDDMVAIEICGTLNYFTFKFLQHYLLLVSGKYLKAGLDDPTSMLVS